MNQPQTAPRVTVNVSRELAVPPERVYDAWLDPEVARRWLFATPTGEMVRAETDPRVGGQFNFTERREGEDVEHVGEYLELDRPRRIVFEFAVPKFSAERTKLTIDIAPHGSGSQVNLTHEGVLPDYEVKTREGWGMVLAGLARVVEVE